MDLSNILIILLAMGGVQARPLFDFLPPVIIDENQQISMDHNSHTTIFFPVGKYATDVHYMIIRIPIFLQPVEDGLSRCGEVLHHMNNAIKGKATEAPIKDIIKFHNDTFHRVNFNYKNMLQNLPEAPFTPYGSRKKRFLDLLFGIAGTAFGVANRIEITRINSIIAKNIHRTDMMVDIQQLHENHLYKLDNMIKNVGQVVTDFIKFSPAVASAYLDNMIESMHYTVSTIASALEQAQNQKLSHLLFPNDILKRIKNKIDATALANGYISYVNKVTDLFQIPLSYVWQPNNKTLALLLHVPLVKEEYLLNMNQYLPFPLTQTLSNNHSLTPSVGQNDILAYSGFETYKILSQSDLASCNKMGDTYFCKGRNDLRTDITNTCLGSLYLQQGKGIQKNCKFEITAAKEQVFRLAHNKWAIATQKQFTTHQVCGKTRKPVTVGPGTTITLDPGCKIRLQSHILTADTLEEEVIETTHFSWTWNATQIFPDLEPQQFSKAMQSLNDYGLHIVDAADIAHHLKFENFNDPIPTSITDLFSNPMHSISLVFFAIVILFLCYKLYMLYRKKIHDKLKATLPTSIAVNIPSIPSAPPPYVHNQPSMGMINIPLH